MRRYSDVLPSEDVENRGAGTRTALHPKPQMLEGYGLATVAGVLRTAEAARARHGPGCGDKRGAIKAERPIRILPVSSSGPACKDAPHDHATTRWDAGPKIEHFSQMHKGSRRAHGLDRGFEDRSAVGRVIDEARDRLTRMG